MTSLIPTAAAAISIAALLLVPTLFALGAIDFAPGRRRKMTAVLAVPLVLGALLLLAKGCMGLVGAWLLIPAAHVCSLYAVAEIFLKVSGRELNNILETFIHARHAIDTIVCTLAVMLMTLVPSLIFYQVFVVNQMCAP